MQPIRKPWTGDRWEETGLLVLGESHYHYPGEDPEDVHKTIETVESAIAGTKMRFFTAVERAITGAEAGRTNPAQFFPTIAFANFCQGSAEGPGGAKTPEMWARGISALPVLLREIRPRRMLVFSTLSWNRFMHLEGLTWRHERHIEIGAYKEDTGYLETTDGTLKVYCMNVGHPNGRDWGGADGWHPFITEFMSHPI